AVSRVAVSHLRDDTGPGGMVVAPGEQCRARRGAQRRGMEARIAQTHLRYTVQIWRRDLPSERAPLPEPRVVDQDDEDVRRAGGSFGQRDRPRLRVFVGSADLGVAE